MINRKSMNLSVSFHALNGILFLSISSLLLSGCGKKDESPAAPPPVPEVTQQKSTSEIRTDELTAIQSEMTQVYFSGAVLDASTGLEVKDFKMTVETAFGQTEATRLTSGNYSFSVPVTADFTLHVSAEGYRDFESVGSNRLNELVALKGSRHYDSKDLLGLTVNVSMIPSSMTSDNVSLRFLDQDNAASITQGYFRLIPSSNDIGLMTSIYGTGTIPGFGNASTFMPKANPVAGTIDPANGTATIDGTKLVPGVIYKLIVYGVTGYTDLLTNISVGTQSQTSDKGIEVLLKKALQNSDPKFLASNIAEADGRAKSLKLGDALTYTFDRNIEIDSSHLTGATVADLGDIFVSDNNNDGKTLLIIDKTSKLDQFIKLSVAGTVLKFDFVFEGSLLKVDGAYDDIDVQFSDTFLGSIYVREAGASTSQWVPLSNYVQKAKVKIGNNVGP